MVEQTNIKTESRRGHSVAVLDSVPLADIYCIFASHVTQFKFHVKTGIVIPGY